MPSASAKTEKTSLIEACDIAKQVILFMEKKVRNLEKKKQKLDNYKSAVANGKDLNDDQKDAIGRYGHVIEVLEFSKEITKAFILLFQETARIQKKLAKKEQIERQQLEIQRLQEALYFRHILASLEIEDIRNDFLAGENGALKVIEDDMRQLDQFYKLIGSDLPNDQADLDGHFHALAENMLFLVDGRNKDIAGTTYKVLKELMKGIKDSGYFSRALESTEEVSSDEIPEVDDIVVENQTPSEDRTSSSHLDFEPAATDAGETEVIPETEELEIVETIDNDEAVEPVPIQEKNTFAMQNGSLQEVLASQGSFNFLQESQIELDTPHMDPAVVAVHQMAPPAAMNFSVAQYQAQPIVEELRDPMANGVEHSEISPPPSQIPPPIPIMTNNVPRGMTQHNGSPDFDPSHPIPTQTFTNQSYAIMQNMIVPPGTYVPVTMHHGPLAPHIAPIPIVPGLSPSVSSTNSVPIHVTVAPVPTTDSSPVIAVAERILPKDEIEVETPAMNGNSSGPERVSPQNDQSSERTNDGEGFTPNYHRPYRGRGRGRGQINGYYRGRGNYNNGRGGYQGHNGYSQGGNYRRGPYRGRGNNNMRGGRGSNYTSNRTSQQQQQQPPPQQQ